jgi:hypothetical protein
MFGVYFTRGAEPEIIHRGQKIQLAKTALDAID